jgi:hypothetical protein
MLRASGSATTEKGKINEKVNYRNSRLVVPVNDSLWILLVLLSNYLQYYTSPNEWLWGSYYRNYCVCGFRGWYIFCDYEMGVMLMNNYEATEQAYKNGYEQGKKDALARIPVTNADRIRAMSDEELAKFLEKASWICANQVCRKCPLSTGTDKCKSVEEWLKQPAEVE